MPSTAPPSPIEIPPAGPPHRRSWLRSFRAPVGWRNALREFVVIMAGVLAAFAAQAWWEDHQERTRERDYLHQLLADTRENERRLTNAIEEDSAAGRATARALVALE